MMSAARPGVKDVESQVSPVLGCTSASTSLAGVCGEAVVCRAAPEPRLQSAARPHVSGDMRSLSLVINVIKLAWKTQKPGILLQGDHL